MAPIIVSVITPTYNRRRFIPYLIQCYDAQTYKK
jgi:glycosyltransferase involved in cell wall biosynthesis